MSDKKPKLPSISKVKKALHEDWALRVKARDGHKCLLCGCTELLTAHHWYFTRQRGHAARYCVDNGATLCFTCHIREVHENPGYATVNAVRKGVMARSPEFDEASIIALSQIEVTTANLRQLWDAMRARPVTLDNYNARVDLKGGKLFLTVDSEQKIAVVGNTILTPCFGLHEVNVVSPSGHSYRYTLRKLEE